MSVMKDFKANITIGGSLSSSLKSSFGFLSQSYEKISNELSGLKSKQRQLNKELSDAKKSGEGLKIIENQYQDISAKIEKNILKQKQLSTSIENAKTSGASITALQNKYDALGLDIKNATFKQNDLTHNILQSKTAISSINALEAEYKQLGTQIGIVSQKQAKLNAKKLNRENRPQRRDEARGDLFDKVALGYMFAQPIKSAIQFESVMADLNKVANYTGAEYKSASKDILGLSRTMPMATTEIAKIYTAAAQSGIAKTELKGFAENAIKMGIAFDITGDRAGQMMANWQAGMKLSTPQILTMADAINAVSNNSNATASNISEVVTRMGATAKTAGLATSEIVGLSASLLQAGTAPEVAGTALKNFTNNLTKGTAAPKALRGAFKSIGMDAVQISKDMQKDAEGTIFKVLEAVKSKVPKHEQSAVLSGLVGEEAKGAIAPLLENITLAKKVFKQAKDAAANAGSMSKEYEARSKTTENDMILLGNSVNELSVSLGTILLPAVKQVASGIAMGASVIASFAEKYPVLTKYVVMAGGAFVTFSIGLAAARWAMLALSTATPLGWIALAVTAVVTLGTIIYNNWDGIWAKTKKVWGAISGFFSWCWAGISQAFTDSISWVGTQIQSLLTWASPLIDGFKIVLDFYVNMWTTIGGAFLNGVNFVIGHIKSLLAWTDPLISGLKSAFEWMGLVSDKKSKTDIMMSATGVSERELKNFKTAMANDNFKTHFNGGTGKNINDNSKTNVNINITPHPNQSPQDIGKQVASRMAVPKKRTATSYLYDAPE